jgi:hypothetical protein
MIVIIPQAGSSVGVHASCICSSISGRAIQGSGERIGGVKDATRDAAVSRLECLQTSCQVLIVSCDIGT